MNKITLEESYNLLKESPQTWDDNDTKVLKIVPEDYEEWDVVNNVSIGSVDQTYLNDGLNGEVFDKLEIHSIIQSQGMNSDYKWLLSIIKGVNKYVLFTTPMEWHGSWSYTQKDDTYYLCNDINEVKELVLSISSDPWWK